MSSFLKVAVLAAATAMPLHAQADAYALTPPISRTELPTPVFPEPAFFADALPLPPIKASVAVSDDFTDIVMRQANISNLGTACSPSIALEPAAGAMLDLELNAPCQPSSLVTVAHSGLSFTLPLSMTGHAHVRVPAMSEDAEITATLEDGLTLAASLNMPQVSDYARVALQWDGADPGELIAAAPAVLKGDMFHLGTTSSAQGKVLHVFSRRMDDLGATGVVRLSLRSDVTAQNCADGHATKVRRTVPGEPIAVYDMQIKGPGCDAIGQSLELKNVLQDLKVSVN